MDLNSRSDFVKLVCRNTYSQIVTTGIIVSIILGIVSVIFTSVLFNIWKLRGIFHYIIVFSIVVVLTNTLSYIVARRSISRTNILANRFIEFIEKLSIAINSDKVELLETAPLPFIAVLKQSKNYIVVKHYDYYTDVSVLDPFKVSKTEGYIPIYLRKHSEIMTCREIGFIKTCTYRVSCVIPEPNEDAIIEGLFYSREFRLVSRELDYLVKNIVSILRELLETKNPST